MRKNRICILACFHHIFVSDVDKRYDRTSYCLINDNYIAI